MANGDSHERPVLWGHVRRPVPYNPINRGGSKVNLPSRSSQGSRLGGRFEDIEDAFSEQITLTQSLGASDPQLVVVFEAIDERADLARVAKLAGLEILAEVEQEYEPDPNFPRKTANQDLPVTGCLHAVCINEQSRGKILAQWRLWQATGQVDHGYAPLRDIFAHLKDVRPWGPQDRVRFSELAAALAGMLPGDHTIEIELWYRLSSSLRRRAQDEVARLIQASGGRVLSVAQADEVGYHGMKCTVPLEMLRRLAAGDLDAVMAVKSSHVMYLRASAQSYSFSDEVPAGAVNAGPLPTGDPVLCVLDGVPIANHPRLSGRVIVTDPDDLSSGSATETELRRHGTAMASVSVWGDLSSGASPAARPVLIRPILTPALDTQEHVEEIGAAELAPDLMRRIFRELFDGDGNTAPAAESIVILNLSVGDPAAPFDGVISSWARTIDWLSVTYGVVVVVSAGNHGSLPVPSGVDALSGVNGTDRADAINAVVAETVPRRSLLAPADSMNALTVGALNADGAGSIVLGYRFDPADGELIVNPTSALGAGYRRSVKPDLIAPGGRALFRTPVTSGDTELRPAPQGAYGPGIRVAASNGTDEIFTMGSSPAAAMVSRDAARVVDSILSLADRQLTRSELAVATKALVAHSARVPDDLRVHTDLRPYAHGYGIPVRSIADGCEPHEASILYVGNLGANEQSNLSFPLPNGLQQTGLKRVTATLAWLSPVNWRHRQYRCAALDFSKPTGFTELGSALDVNSDRSKRGTLQHAVWEVNRAIGFGVGSTLDLTVHCKEQAGGLKGDRVDFAVVLSLWVAPTLNVDVYTQVQQQLAARVAVTPDS
jgi:hypothetical protein